MSKLLFWYCNSYSDCELQMFPHENCTHVQLGKSVPCVLFFRQNRISFYTDGLTQVHLVRNSGERSTVQTATFLFFYKGLISKRITYHPIDDNLDRINVVG